MRERLFKIGFTSEDLKNLDADKAKKFILISNELDKLKNEAQEKANKKRGK